MSKNNTIRWIPQSEYITHRQHYENQIDKIMWGSPRFVIVEEVQEIIEEANLSSDALKEITFI